MGSGRAAPSGSSGKWAALRDRSREMALLWAPVDCSSWHRLGGLEQPAQRGGVGAAGGHTERGSSARGEDSVCKQTPCVTLGTISN